MKLAHSKFSITEMYPGPVINTFLPNPFLPSNFEGYVCILFDLTVAYTNTLCRLGEFNLSSPVLVVQINAPEPVQLPENGTVSIGFEMPEVCG